MKKTKIKDIFIINNLFSKDELTKVHQCLELITWLDDPNSSNKYIDMGPQGPGIPECSYAADKLTEKNNVLKKNIEKDFQCTLADEGMGTIVKYAPGWTLNYHADCWSDLPTYSGHPSRDISSVVYLTDDFEGGTLLFPDLDIEISPLAGSAVYFPSDEQHMHTVTEVISGNRSTCTGFWHILDRSL